MKLLKIVVSFLILILNTSATPVAKISRVNYKVTVKKNKHFGFKNIYELWKLAAVGISENAFNDAIKGYNYLKEKNLLSKANLITIVDFSKPSSTKRMFVIDMSDGQVLFNTYTAHGKNSGLEYATDFSNKMESHKTSLGFFITLGTYVGANGYSLKLKGCEKGINNNAFERAIVIHGAAYANENYLQQNGYLGRSFGCPALPQNLNKEIINKIKDGSCLFLYHPTKKYTTQSKILNS